VRLETVAFDGITSACTDYLGIGVILAAQQSSLIGYDLCALCLHPSACFTSYSEFRTRMREKFDGAWSTHSVHMLTDYHTSHPNDPALLVLPQVRCRKYMPLHARVVTCVRCRMASIRSRGNLWIWSQ
jgi:hypothetical protein